MTHVTQRLIRKLFAIAIPIAVVFACATAAAGTWPSDVTSITSSSTTAATVSGNLTSGKTIDLAFAANSSVACFPATEFVNFKGNHVLYATTIPPQSEMTITATPDDSSLDVSLYAYTMSATDFTHVPPNVPSAVACESSYDKKNDSNPGKAEKVKLVATTQGYNVVIGVAGVNNVKAGAFKLKVELVTKATVTSATLTPTAITANGNSSSTTGNLTSGGVIDLAWAANSSMACWPATENVNFNGNHVLYKINIPKQSEMTIKVAPSSQSLDLSLYAYTQAVGKTTVPPGVSSAVSCEAGYDQRTDNNPGVTESVKLIATTNSYDVIIGVAGANNTKSGAFTLTTEVKPR